MTETVEELMAKVDTLTKTVDTITAEKATIETEKASLAKEKADLEGRLAQKGKDFKKLRDMGDAEKELLSETERALLERQDELDKRAADIEKQQTDFISKTKESTKNSIIQRYAKGDVKIAEKIAFHYGRLNDPETTPEEIEKKVADAVKFVPEVVGVTGAGWSNGAGGGQGHAPGDIQDGKSFADTEAGKEMSTKLFGHIKKPDADKK